MKVSQKDTDKLLVWRSTRALPKLMVWLILFVIATYIVYTLKLVMNSRSCDDEIFPAISHRSLSMHKLDSDNFTLLSENQETFRKTEVKDIVFGIAASAKLWEKRKNYIKLWWKPEKMRGIVWLDNPVKGKKDEGLPPVKISGNTSRFAYKNRQGHRSAIRISRIVSETLRLGMENVRWFVMGDDDTVFVTENLVRILNKYDHNQYYYIGSLSESHLQNIYFSYGMAYGGGGFAISYPLAKALVKMQDDCIQRYPGLYGSDDRMQACMAELGVPLTKELGFHQYDVYGNLFGLLAAHPVTPLVSLHHLDVVEPIFPNVTRVEALRRLTIPMKLDSAGLIQQSICYEKTKTWTISVSWGFAIQIVRGVLSPREIEMPTRTFLNWYRRADYTAYAFNTRPVARNPCQRPFVFYLSRVRFDSITNQTMTVYDRHRVPHPACKWNLTSPAEIDRVVVYKKPDPHLWDRSPRRNCCRILESKKKSMVLDVGVCGEGEISVI
ncbi:Transferring glycosyl group transferase [Heracleum sosnowskyi]|uniref:Transferring glycosyl group transferase n=1 Tax=Heracleum sosnowskyi TaxID=360622 RepID=A0AAD8HZL5_9APIA|nr:Transferring glycosyl group transferase [Heracleum sosnowskyi]KAK1374847.1 Transferring glycosyl group transferase [Heracleum sosnowskyi]